MGNSCRIGLQSVAVLLCLASPSLSRTFMALDVPGATRTVATGINNRGDVVGYYVTPDGRGHGFLWADGEFITIDAADPTQFVTLHGINDRGDIVGLAGFEGFVLSDGVFTSIQTPNGQDVVPFDINNRGDIVGYYSAGPGIGNVGFLMEADGSFHTFAPRAFTLIQGINEAGDMIGVWGDIGGHGVSIDKKGVVTFFDIPNAQFTLPRDISGTGAIVGTVSFASSADRGFVLHPDGAVELIDATLLFAVSTQLWGVNTRGDIVGSFVSGGLERGFVATK